MLELSMVKRDKQGRPIKRVKITSDSGYDLAEFYNRNRGPKQKPRRKKAGKS